MAQKCALVLIADGSEEMESCIAIDCLRRAGIDVTVASISGLTVTCAQKVKIQADCILSSLQSPSSYDCLVLPGGMGGAKTFQSSPAVQSLLSTYCKSEEKIVGIICASPIALLPLKLCVGRKLTCYPSLRKEFEDEYEHMGDRVVRDGNLITSQGPGTAMEWALELVNALMGEEVRDKTENPLLAPILR